MATRPSDFRKGIDGVALLVQEVLGFDPFSGAAFVFRAKRADRIKILVWDGTGVVLVHKRIEGATFVWPREQDGVMKMPPAQFLALFEGLDRRLVRPRTRAAAGACGMIASEWLSSVLSVAGPRSLCLIAVMTDTALAEANVRLKARLAESEAALADAVEAQRRLECIVSELRREKFGPRSEKLDPEQFNLPLEDVELAQGVLEAAQEKARRALKGQGPANGTPNRNRGHLPKHLPSHRAYHRA